MKKMKKIKLTAAALALFSLVGCSDFLSEVPDNRTQLDSPEKISELLVNAYPQRDYMYFTEAMTDNFGDSKRVDMTELDNTKYFQFEDNQVSDWDSPIWYWESAYSAIAHANQALAAIEELGNSNGKLNPQKGEALLARAYAHFMLVNIFSQAYDPATASSELGVPYMTAVETKLIVNYKRNTVQEVYDLIEKDLLEGMELVGNTYKKPGYHFTKEAARSFAAKFYTYKGDWDKVLDYSNGLGDFPVKKLRNLAEDNGVDKDIQSQNHVAQSTPTNLLLSAGNSAHTYGLAASRYGLNTELQAVIGKEKNPFGKEWLYARRWLLYQQNANVFANKFFMYWIYEGSNTDSGKPFITFVLLSHDDTYLNRIEATIMNGDLDKATEMIAYYAKFKTYNYVETDKDKVTKDLILSLAGDATDYQPFYGLSGDQQKFVKYLAEIRRREFVGEGARWFDIKRYNLEVKHIDLLTNQEYILNKKDLRKAIQLPSHLNQFGVELNPR